MRDDQGVFVVQGGSEWGGGAAPGSHESWRESLALRPGPGRRSRPGRVGLTGWFETPRTDVPPTCRRGSGRGQDDLRDRLDPGAAKGGRSDGRWARGGPRRGAEGRPPNGRLEPPVGLQVPARGERPLSPRLGATRRPTKCGLGPAPPGVVGAPPGVAGAPRPPHGPHRPRTGDAEPCTLLRAGPRVPARRQTAGSPGARSRTPSKGQDRERVPCSEGERVVRRAAALQGAQDAVAVRVAHAGVPGGRADVAVSEQGLDDTQVGA